MSLHVENPYPSVELLVKPLFEKLPYLLNLSSKKPARSRRSKTQNAILSSVVQSPDISNAVGTAFDDLYNTGQIFQDKIQSFTADPTNPKICDSLHDSGTAFLSSLTRLLILAQLSEKSHLINIIKTILDNIENILSSTSTKQLIHSGEGFRANAARLINLLNRNSNDFQRVDKTKQCATLQYVLKHNNRLLLSAAKVHLYHPEIISALALRDNVASTISDALHEFQSVLDGNRKVQNVSSELPEQLLHTINDFENNVLLGHRGLVNGKSSTSFRESFQNQMDSLIHVAHKISNSADTKQEERAAIQEKCNHLRHSITQVVNNSHQDVNGTVQNILKITGGLKDQLQRTTVGHAVQVLVVNEQPLMSLSDATKFGDDTMITSFIERFKHYSKSLVNAAHEVISLTANEDISKSVLLASAHLEQLSPQIVQAAQLLFHHPTSKSIEANYETFKTAYQETSALLQTALKELISVHDFLTAADVDMKKDFDRSLAAISEQDDATLQQLSTTMQHRASLVGSIVSSKMTPMLADRDYVDQVMNKVILLRDEHTPNFVTVSRDTVSRLAAQQPFNLEVYQEACDALCRALHGLRMAALKEVALPSELQSLKTQTTNLTIVDDLAFDGACNEPGPSSRSSSSTEQRAGLTDMELEETVAIAFAFLDNEGSLAGGSQSSSQSLVSQQENRHYQSKVVHQALTGPEQEHMHQELAGFLHEKNTFMKEVNKWDDSGNEVVLLAKKMCLIMMEMTDYTRGKGPLTSTAQIIRAAREISDLGRRLDQLSRGITEVCPDSHSRRDLLAYRQRITLHCQQLDITTRVKAGIRATRSEEIENATALIQAARNLMNAVVLTVKESYLASTMYTSIDPSQPTMQWNMRAPSKKPLINEDSDSTLEADDRSDDRYRFLEADRLSNENQQSIRSSTGRENRNTMLYRSRRPRHFDALTELSEYDGPKVY